MFKKSIHGQFVNQFMNIHVSKKRPFRLSSFALRLFLSFPLSSSLFLSFPLFVFWSLRLLVSSSLCLLDSLSLPLFPLFSSLFLSFPPLLSLFNTRPALPANSLKTKDLRKRHFRLKILSQGKPLRLKTLDAKFAQ